MKKILLLSNYFYPENFKVNELAFKLAGRGHDITVVTAIPNYPDRNLFKKDYGFLKNRKEVINGVKIVRIPLIYRGSGSAFRLVLNYISFLIVSSIYSLFIALFKKYDVIFVHHVSPIFVAIPAIILKTLNSKKLIMWNLDLWPEAIIGASSLKNKRILYPLNSLIRFINKRIDFMLVSSKGFIPHLIDRDANPSSIRYFPNWVDDETNKEECKFTLPTEGFNIMFAGNIGKAQDPESLIKLIFTLKELKINWIFIGGGRALNRFKETLKELNIVDNVFFPGVFPLIEMPSLYRQTDVLLISLNKETSYTLPGRVQAYLNSGKPILGMVNGETNDLINSIGCGKCVPSADYVNLSTHVKLFQSKTKKELNEIGMLGRKYAKENFNIESNIVLLESIFKEL